MRKEVSVEELEFGVFIAELDRPWTETPFIFQGFVLNNDKQLATLKKYCKKVFIDLDKGLDLPERSQLQTASLSTGPKPPSVLASIKTKVDYEEQASVDVELPARAHVPEQDRVSAAGLAGHGQGRQGDRRPPRKRGGDEHDRQRRAQPRRDAAARQDEGEGRAQPRPRGRSLHLHDHVRPLPAIAARAARSPRHARIAAGRRKDASAGRDTRTSRNLSARSKQCCAGATSITRSRS